MSVARSLSPAHIFMLILENIKEGNQRRLFLALASLPCF